MLNHFTPTWTLGISHIATVLLGAIGFQHPPNRPSRFPCSLCTIRPSLAPRAGCPCLHSMSFPAGPVHRYFSPCSLPRVQISLAAPSSQAWIRLSATSTHRDEASAMSFGGALVWTPTWASTMPVATRSKTKSQNQAQGGHARKHASKKKNATESPPGNLFYFRTVVMRRFLP